MGKKLAEMSMEELWGLFPILLTEHQEYWEEWYQEGQEQLEKQLSLEKWKRISHIGSTAVPSIWAKPIVDILLEVPAGANMESIKEILQENDWTSMNQSQKRMSFNKGYTEHGFAERVYHLHLRYAGDNDELYFRDYLVEEPTIAKEYERLKLSLWKEYEHNRDGYTKAKEDFVMKYTEQAKQRYPGRYLPIP